MTPAPPTVRKATSADRATIAATMANAFAHDPVFCWMAGTDDSERRLGPFWRGLAKSATRKVDHETYITGDGGSVAVWRGIDDWKTPISEMIRAAPALIASLRLRTPLSLRLLGAIEKAHPTEPHYYLEGLGTRRDRQGNGYGSAVITAMLDRCDAEGIPAYLESSNPRNIPFYARHGFVERGVIHAPGGAPPITPMWRDPRGA